jgi:hypothetical protein
MDISQQTVGRRRRGAAAAMLAGYLAVLGLIGFWPSPVDQGAAGPLHRVLGWADGLGVDAWFAYDLIETGANVLLFVPLGWLVATALPLRRAWLGLVAGAAAASLIEAGQALFRPERFPLLQDVLANSLGAAIGTVAVYAWACRQQEGSTAESAADGSRAGSTEGR